jgi:hypothetical protein
VRKLLLLLTLLLTPALWGQITSQQIVQWQPQSSVGLPPYGTIYQYLNQATGLLVCVNYLGVNSCGSGGGGTGTVTHTTGALTANAMLAGNGGADIKVADGNGVLESIGAITTDIQPLKIAWTFNNVSQVFNGVEFVCTNTASAVGSFCLQALGGSAGTTALLQLDTAGDLTAAGTVTGNILASAGSGAGSMQLTAGVLPSLTGSSAGFTAPTSVGTAYSLVLPSAGPSGTSVLEFGAVSGGFSTGSFVAAGSSFANTALSNLASVSINTALLAQTGVDLGSTTAPFRNVYIFGSGTFASDYIEFTGNPSTGDVATFPDNTGTVGELNFAQTWSAAQTFSAIGNFSAAGASSTPGLKVTGAPYTGGNSTTNFPQFYVNDGTGPSTFSLNGTEVGINTPSSFTGNLLDFHVNGGATVAKLDYLGNYTGLAYTSIGTTAGFIDLPQGSTSGSTAPCNTATSICIQAPTSVTSQLRVLAGAPASGFSLWTNSSGTMTETIAAAGGTLNSGVGLLGTLAINTVLASTVANVAGHFTNLQVVTSLGGGTCSTVPIFNVFDGTSNTGSTVTASASTQTKGTGTSTAQTLTFAAGDIIGIYISTAGATCTTDQFIVSAQYSIP